MRLTLLLIAGAVVACGPNRPAASPSPIDLAALEAQQAAHPNDPRVLTDVGVALYRANAFERSRDVLMAALVLAPKDSRAAIHLGLAHEGLAQTDLAIEAYRRALALPVSREERQAIDGRLAALTKQALTLAAKRAIAAEATLGTRPPAPNTVAVLPWTYLGADSTLKPLERGLAHLLVTDLAKVSRLTLLERDRVQALVDELALAAVGRVDSSTAARSGRLLGAAAVIQGAFRETGSGNLRLDASVVSAENATIRASGSASDQLSRLFAMEKSVVFDLLDRWGISLTPAERRAISEQPTADLQAFLAFSRGLMAEDRGDWGAAGAMYREAIRIDPSFRGAQDHSRQSARAAAMPRAPAASLALAADRRQPSLKNAHLGAAIQNIAPTLAGRFGRAQQRAMLALRSRLAEALHQDDPTRLRALTDPTSTIPR